jgi:N-acetylglucosamine malate deacetylase 1
VDVLHYLQQLRSLREHAQQSLRPSASRAPRETNPNAPVVAIVSPHPDDECIVGGLALRLADECGWRVLNIAVTQGSNPARQLAGARELRAACADLGWECHFFGERGLGGVSPAARDAQTPDWKNNVGALREVLATARPQLILAPHAADAQATHVATHALTLDALATLPSTFATRIAFTEYWSTMACPNLLVSLSENTVAQLLSALMRHAGEIARNPYHTTLPLWMMDAVRRGSERVGGAGGGVADAAFATLYTVHPWHNGALQPAEPAAMVIDSDSLRAQFG